MTLHTSSNRWQSRMTVTVNLLFKLLLWVSLNESVTLPTAGFALREAKLNGNSSSNSPQNSEETGKYPTNAPYFILVQCTLSNISQVILRAAPGERLWRWGTHLPHSILCREGVNPRGPSALENKRI